MDFGDLAEHIASAVREANAPPPPGETRPFRFASDLLSDDGWSLLWEAVHAVRGYDPKTFAQMTEISLALGIADAFESDPGLDLPSLNEQLKTSLAAFGPRIVSTPIANVVVESSAVRLADKVVLLRGLHDKDAPGSDEDDVAALDTRQWLGASMSRTLRVVDLDGGIDTTRTATLLTIEDGIEGLAVARARARAQYAIAMWTVLAPQEGKKVLPDVGNWVPQPTTHIRSRHRPLESAGAGPAASESGGDIHRYGAFVLPNTADLCLPFEAMDHLDTRGAQAVLTASLHFLASSRASRLQPSERARALLAAMESLGEKPSGNGQPRQRFMALAKKYGADRAGEVRGWSPKHVEGALRRMVNVRNIATHGADGVLIDLGYPPDALRKLRHAEAPGSELALGSLLSDLPILTLVVHKTLEGSIRSLSATGWAEGAFEKLFSNAS